jgi:hypothetical protein
MSEAARGLLNAAVDRSAGVPRHRSPHANSNADRRNSV